MELIEVKIGALLLDPNSNSPIVVLKGSSNELVLPIWVGPFEANAIASEIEKRDTSRPMTHDLFRNLLVTSEIELVKTVITELRDNTFYAVIECKNKNRGTNSTFSLDARPSDAIAIALRMDSQIFVNKEVFDVSQKDDSGNILDNQKHASDSGTSNTDTDDWPAQIA